MNAALPDGARSRGEPGGPLLILLACPKCGAPFAADDETVSLACDHCGSLLVLGAPARDEIYFCEGQLRGPDEILDLFVGYRVQARRAEIVGRYRDREGQAPPDAWVAAQLADFERSLRGDTRLLEARRFHAPYWHITGKIVQGTLGRRADGPKQVRLRAFAVEHSVPGYDAARANLRDRGLRLARSHVRPLTVRVVAERGPFLAARVAPDRPYREIDKWKLQNLEPGLEAVTRHGDFLFGRRVLVYRPYWLARVASDAGEQWILADDSFGTLAGYPDEAEARALLALATPDPLRSGEESYRRVHVSASRCPECGQEQSLDSRYWFVVCPNCHRGLVPDPGGLRLASYAHATSDGTPELDGDWLPFWRFPFSVRVPGVTAASLEDYAKIVFPKGPPPGFAARGPHLWVPAFRLLGTEQGDEAFQACVAWSHAAGLAADDSKIPLGGHPALWGSSLAEGDARELAPFVLLGLHGKAAAARLNTLAIQRAVQQARIELGAGSLVMVPFERVADEVRIRNTPLRFAQLLLRGGPALDAQRATVHAAAAARA